MDRWRIGFFCVEDSTEDPTLGERVWPFRRPRLVVDKIPTGPVRIALKSEVRKVRDGGGGETARKRSRLSDSFRRKRRRMHTVTITCRPVSGPRRCGIPLRTLHHRWLRCVVRIVPQHSHTVTGRKTGRVMAGWGERGRTLSDDPYFYLSRPIWYTTFYTSTNTYCLRTCVRAYKIHTLRTAVSESGRIAFIKQPLYAFITYVRTYAFTHANTCLSACGKKQISPTYAVGIGRYQRVLLLFFFPSNPYTARLCF